MLVLLAVLGILACDRESGSSRGHAVAQADVLDTVPIEEIVRDVTLAGDGAIQLVVSGPLFAWRVHRGDVARSGARGRGPGDFLAPWTFVRGLGATRPWGTWDVGRRALIPAGNDPETAAITFPTVPSGMRADLHLIAHAKPFSAFSTATGFVVNQYRRPPNRSLDLGELVLLSLDGGGTINDTLWTMSVRDTTDVRAHAVIAAHLPTWTMCDDRVALVADALERQLLWLGPPPSGRGRWVRTRTVPIPLGTRELVRADAEALAADYLMEEYAASRQPIDSARLAASVARFLDRRPSRVPSTWPPVQGIFCQGTSVAMVEHSLPHSPARVAIAHGEEGFRIATLPPGFRAYEMVDSALIGTIEMQDGSLRLARVKP